MNKVKTIVAERMEHVHNDIFQFLQNDIEVVAISHSSTSKIGQADTYTVIIIYKENEPKNSQDTKKGGSKQATVQKTKGNL